MIRMGEERIEKRKKESTEVPLLTCVWINLKWISIDHHPKQKKSTKKILEKMLWYQLLELNPNVTIR